MEYCPLGLVYGTVYDLVTIAYEPDSLCPDIGRYH